MYTFVVKFVLFRCRVWILYVERKQILRFFPKPSSLELVGEILMCHMLTSGIFFKNFFRDTVDVRYSWPRSRLIGLNWTRAKCEGMMVCVFFYYDLLRGESLF